MPDPARQQRLAQNLATLRAGLDNRYLGYTILNEIAADCRHLHLCVTDVLTVLLPADPMTMIPPAPQTNSFVCVDCGRHFASHHALCGHQRVHKVLS